MPQSKGRQKNAKKRYQLEPARKKKVKPPKRWYAPVVLSVMGVGVIVIVLNYMQVLPFTGGTYRPLVLWLGLGLILVGFVGTMGIR
jgi:hypothetical protein